MTTLTVSELREAAIKERLSKITPGQWFIDLRVGTRVRDDADTTIASAGMASRSTEDAQANAAFIAGAPDDIAYLLAELISAEQQRDQARELLRQSEAQLYRLQALTRSPQSFDMEIVNTDAEWLQRRIREFLAPPAAKEETGK